MSKPSSLKLFVYGSLRQGFESPAYHYISNYFYLVGHGKVQGRLYDLGDYPAAVPNADNGYIVGELYVIKNPDEFDWAIAQLDDYEGINNEEGESPLYRRELATIALDSGEMAEAWVYWYAKSAAGCPVIDSGDLLEYLKGKTS